MLQLPMMRIPRKRPEQVYLRFGLWSGRSKNHATKEYEQGISVYPAMFDGDVVRPTDVDEISPLVKGRLVFPVTGELVATGSDDEPVLRRVRALPYAVDISISPLVRIQTTN